MPWKLLADAATYLDGWLGGIGGLLGPVAGIMIADYWIVRRKQLDVAELYRPHGRHAGVNPVALVALASGVLPNLPGFLAGTKLIAPVVGFFADIYPYAWFSGFFLALGVYVVGSRLRGVDGGMTHAPSGAAG
jgi:NCS1 family nucleobase:cation symporter-1